mmetsp:Transcript_3682/g.5304  ORF Transcript_3682/g.5304 Transcript_3682/m.5304 type:complete len:265 (+) Transcript_3682:302-1096(+)
MIVHSQGFCGGIGVMAIMTIFVVALLPNDYHGVSSFTPPTHPQTSRMTQHHPTTKLAAFRGHNHEESIMNTRRSVLHDIFVNSVVATSATAAVTMPQVSNAASDTKPAEFTNVGTQAPAPVGESAFVTLPNGVQIKDFKVGSGADSITSTSSKVSIQCSGRLLNLNGVIFYNTKNNNPDGFGAIPLTFDMNVGQIVPGLESGLVGMKKGGIRRIIVPANLAYSNYPNLEPQPMNANDQRALDSVVKNPRRDATILFDVQVERFK